MNCIARLEEMRFDGAGKPMRCTVTLILGGKFTDCTDEITIPWDKALLRTPGECFHATFTPREYRDGGNTYQIEWDHPVAMEAAVELQYSRH